MRTITTTQAPRYETVIYAGQPMNKVLPEPPPALKFTLRVQVGFDVVEVTVDEPMTADCHYDKHANAERLISQAVALAFNPFQK